MEAAAHKPPLAINPHILLRGVLFFSHEAMTALKKAQTQERRRGYIWGVGEAHAPYIPIFPNDGCFFKWTQAMYTS